MRSWTGRRSRGRRSLPKEPQQGRTEKTGNGYGYGVTSRKKAVENYRHTHICDGESY